MLSSSLSVSALCLLGDARGWNLPPATELCIKPPVFTFCIKSAINSRLEINKRSSWGRLTVIHQTWWHFSFSLWVYLHRVKWHCVSWSSIYSLFFSFFIPREFTHICHDLAGKGVSICHIYSSTTLKSPVSPVLQSTPSIYIQWQQNNPKQESDLNNILEEYWLLFFHFLVIIPSLLWLMFHFEEQLLSLCLSCHGLNAHPIMRCQPAPMIALSL